MIYSSRLGRGGVQFKLCIFWEKLLRSGEEKGVIVSFFLDIRKAYDRVLRDVLWDQLREAGYGGKVLRLIQRLYDDNQGNFRLGGIRGRRMGRNRGLRQGCVLSPFYLQHILGRQWRCWWRVSLG